MSAEQEHLDRAIDSYPPAVAATARAALARLRTRFPGARLLVYDRPRSLPIGLAPAGGGGAVFSVVLYPRWVRFFFLEGAALPDPKQRLEGTGSQVRSIVVDDDAAVLDDPYVRGLIGKAVTLSGADLKAGDAAVVIKSSRQATAGRPRMVPPSRRG
ncbi:MAG: hypothetical protein R2712_14970 [Vicinamibacterales bacterium]